MAEATSYTVDQLRGWQRGETTPQNQTLEYICNLLFTPEFRIVCEFAEFNPDTDLRPQLRAMLQEHSASSGIYAFYDSIASLLYVGKATTLIDEIYSALCREDTINFPAGISNKTLRRYQLTRYISAYEVPEALAWDYPKHVESLILRISKPQLNKQIGILEAAYPSG